MFKPHSHFSPVLIHRLRWLSVAILLAGIALILAPRAEAQSSSWTANYWNSKNFSGPIAAQRIEAWPNYDWGTGSPIPGVVGNDNFSVQWTSSQQFDPGYYRFTVTADDGVRLWVNNHLVIDAWLETPSSTHTVEYNIPDGGLIPVQVDYFEGRGNAEINVSWERVTGSGVTGPVLAQYWNNQTLSGDPILTRYEDEVNYNWGNGSPAPGVIQPDHFSARWTRTMNLPTGEYEVSIQADDGVRFYIDNRLMIDAWHPATGQTYTVNTQLSGNHQFKVEYYDSAGLAYIYVNATRVDVPTDPGHDLDPNDPAGVVTASYLNVRGGPGVEFDVVEVAQRGTVVQFTGVRDSTGTWIEVRLPSGQVGWLNTDYIYTRYPIQQLSPIAG